MKTFWVRTFSALVGVSIAGLSYYFLGNQGLRLLSLSVVILGTYELNRLLLKAPDAHLLRKALLGFNTFLFFISCYWFILSSLIFGILAILLFFLRVISHPVYSPWKRGVFGGDNHSRVFGKVVEKKERQVEGKDQEKDLQIFWGEFLCGLFSLFYIGLLPACACHLLNLPRGTFWFIFLLGVVFSNDVLAYLAGRAFGKTKNFPHLSPSKTWMGSGVGLVGATGVAMLLAWRGGLYPQVSWVQIGALGFVVGLAAQAGDLFESLLKRVAQVKDSGRVIPGHGGFLDRFDGVFFGAPLVLLGAVLIEKIWT